MKKRTDNPRAKRARGAMAAPRAAAARPERASGRRSGVSKAARAQRTGAGSRPSADGVLSLPAECTLSGAEGLKLRLAALVKSVKPVTVDVGAVRRIDSATLQLLAAFTRDRRSSDLPIELSGESDAFAEGARLLGLARLFGGVGNPHGSPVDHGPLA